MYWNLAREVWKLAPTHGKRRAVDSATARRARYVTRGRAPTLERLPHPPPISDRRSRRASSPSCLITGSRSPFAARQRRSRPFGLRTLANRLRGLFQGRKQTAIALKPQTMECCLAQTETAAW